MAAPKKKKKYPAKGAKPPPLGTGQRFKAVEKSIAAKGKVRNPGAVTAAIGRKKYGAAKMAKLSAQGRKRKKR